MSDSAKLDKKDLRILYELDFNARIPLSELARRVGLSTQLAKYRLGNLFKKDVINSIIAIIDYHRLGFSTYRIYLRLQKASQEEERDIFTYFINHPRTIWIAGTTGRWDMEVMFSARTPQDANAFLREVKGKWGEHIKNYSTSPSVVNYHFERSYLVENAERRKKIPWFGQPEKPPIKVDLLDVQILEMLSHDGRVSTQELARRLKTSYNCMKQRIANLEQSGVIQSYRTFMNLEKIGRTFYKALITTKQFGDEAEKKMLSFCTMAPEIVYIVECFGEWDLEVECEVKDEAEFRAVMGRFKSAFADVIQDYEVLHVYKEYKMNYFPVFKELTAELTTNVNPGFSKKRNRH
ncbi:MAG: Lrp/AsnC family transcriptional regulator [Candidatus ainarchaeum sp.]|nr:Lrp/AsnC family transcriptional regulator [Candidatus ainarchaeum sp.]